MSHVSDFLKSEQQILLDLVNYANGTAFTLNLVDISFSQGSAENSQVLVTAKTGSGYAGTVTTDYRRLDIADFVDLYYPEGITLAQTDGLMLADYLPEINLTMGTALNSDIVNDVALGPWAGEPNETKLVQLVTKTNSMVYYGQVSITIDGNDIPLDTVITTTILSGLNMPWDYTQLPPVLISDAMTLEYFGLSEGVGWGGLRNQAAAETNAAGVTIPFDGSGQYPATGLAFFGKEISCRIQLDIRYGETTYLDGNYNFELYEGETLLALIPSSSFVRTKEVAGDYVLHTLRLTADNTIIYPNPIHNGRIVSVHIVEL